MLATAATTVVDKVSWRIRSPARNARRHGPVWLVVSTSAGDAKRLVDQRLDRSGRALTLARQLRKLGNDLGEWWGRRIDRQQALLDHDERQVERAGLARLWVPLEFEPVENRLGFVSRLLNGTGDVLVGDAHASGIYTPTSQERGYVHCCDGIGERLCHSTHHTRGTGRNASTSMMPFQGAPSALVKSPSPNILLSPLRHLRRIAPTRGLARDQNS